MGKPVKPTPTAQDKPRDCRPLNASQRQFVSDTLSPYDAQSLTAEQANDIDETLKKAGINPSAQLASVMDKLGFDARAVGDLAETLRPAPPRR